MNRSQNLAWFNLRVLAIAGPLSLIILIISLLASELVVAYVGFFILAVASLIMGLSPVLLRKGPGQVAYDERDEIIRKNSHLIGYSTLLCFLTVTCLFACRPPVGFVILPITLVSVRLVESLATLIQYGRELKGEKS